MPTCLVSFRGPGLGWLVQVQNAILLIRNDKGTLVGEPVNGAPVDGLVIDRLEVPGTGFFLETRKGTVYFVRQINDQLLIENAGAVLARQFEPSLRAFGPNSIVVGVPLTEITVLPGIGHFSVAPIEDPNGHSLMARWTITLANADVLIATESRDLTVLRRVQDTTVPIRLAVPAKVDTIFNLFSLSDHRAPFNTSHGLFVVRPKGTDYVIEPVAEYSDTINSMTQLNPNEWIFRLPHQTYILSDMPGSSKLRVGRIPGWDPHWVPTNENITIPGVGDLIAGASDAFIVSSNPLSNANVTSETTGTISEGASNPALTTPVSFTLTHPCASVLDDTVLHADLLGPHGEIVHSSEHLNIFNFQPGSSVARLTLLLPIHSPGTVQFYTNLDGTRQEVGKPYSLGFTAASWKERMEAAAWYAGVVLAVCNLLLFIAARWSSDAWEIATDDAVSGRALKIGIFILSYSRYAQLWILDLYFRARKSQLRPPPPFASIPLNRPAGAPKKDIDELLEITRSNALWIQGKSGMGKTALVNHIIQRHFIQHKNSFDAYAKWKGIVLAFAARDFVGGTDELNSGWVRNALKQTLSHHEIEFNDDKLLRRMLRKGTLMIVIDGLNEAGRKLSVEAFAKEFTRTRLIVTSQDEGNEEIFAIVQLPHDVQEVTTMLLQKYLPAESAMRVSGRLRESGLADVIENGYDVRLIADLCSADPEHALPTDRLGLYAMMVDLAWPDREPAVKREEQAQVAAAAWRMVSERRSNEDKRRQRPGVYVSSQLLAALAETPRGNKRPARLMRQVGEAYEFVHDQMHFYLAAFWFAKYDATTAELKRMLEASALLEQRQVIEKRFGILPGRCWMTTDC